MEHADLLVEIGTEEMPPRSLMVLARAFEAALAERTERAGIAATLWQAHATPRRLAALAHALPLEQPAREVQRRGPAVTAAFNADGTPTRAALGFAASCGVPFAALERLETDKGSWLVHRATEPGRASSTLLPGIIEESLAALPIARRMRWGAGSAEFVRPVHWLIVLHGAEVVEATIFGVRSGRMSRGHRFHHPAPVEIDRPSSYATRLGQAHVVVDVDQRRERVRAQVSTLAHECGGIAVIDDDLLDEVTALVEWPVAVAGSFDAEFLALPQEVLIATMRDHQRFFHVVDAAGRLQNRFITVANIESHDPAAVRAGNERVIRPRLSDARFFWQQDAARPLGDRLADLGAVVFQQRLGSVLDKTLRVAAGARDIAQQTGADAHRAERAAQLSRCDLLTAMVGEFPELQGIMGGYYAARDGEEADVAAAVGQFYLPRHAGDRLPSNRLAQIIAVADRVDTLVGIFGIGQAPSGDKDPFALRRAALSVLRIIIEEALDLDLGELIASAQHRLAGRIGAGEGDAVLEFMLERLRAHYADQGVDGTTFDAVLATRPTRPLDFHRRLRAVQSFRELAAAVSLAQANKRIANILRKSGADDGETLDAQLLTEPEEQALAAAVADADAAIAPDLAAGEYERALTRLAEIRPQVDAFFDRVLVMADDPRIRANRLALLRRLQALFLGIADVSRLQA